MAIITRHHLAAALALATAVSAVLCVPATAQDGEPLVLLDLATLGPPYHFGTWLQDALTGEPFDLRWPDLDEAGDLEDVPASVVTWSDPTRSGEEARRLRGQLRHGGGMLYVVGSARGHLSATRAFWAPLRVNAQPATGASGFAEWAPHEVTGDLPRLGATTANCFLSGPNGQPLITVTGQAVAMAFDWGVNGRAIVLDQALLGDPLSTERPPASMREFLKRSVTWTIKPAEDSGPVEPGPVPRPEPHFDVPEPEPVGPPPSKVALVDMSAADDNWPVIRAQVVEALQAGGLEVEVASAPGEDEPVFTSASLEGIGVLAIGSCRDFQPAESIAVARFFATGGRLLLVPHVKDQVRNRFRMIYFNEILAELELAASLARPHGQAEFAAHPITEGLRPVPAAPGGIQIWSYLADTLVEVFGLPAAVALQSDTSRLVLMDGGLLLPVRGEQAPAREFLTVLQRSVTWLVGDL